MLILTALFLVAMFMSLMSLYIASPMAQMLAASYCCSKLKMIKKKNKTPVCTFIIFPCLRQG